MRAQASLEYLILFSALLAAMLPIIYIADQQYNREAVASSARLALESTTSAVDSVSALSAGSTIKRTIFFPQGYLGNESYVSEKIIFLKFYLPDGTAVDAFRETIAEVQGELPQYWGLHELTFTLEEDGTVLIKTSASP